MLIENSTPEPILNSSEEDLTIPETNNDKIMEISENEFNPEENDSSEIEEEFNQETEEELLDIPTFLRRQAN